MPGHFFYISISEINTLFKKLIFQLFIAKQIISTCDNYG